MAFVIAHLNEMHEQNLEFEHLSFPNECEFTEWLTCVEIETPCNFQRRYRRGEENSRQYFYCSRSGISSYKPRLLGERKRRLKIQGISKCGRTCPAHVIMSNRIGACVQVKYLAKHFCHSDVYSQLGHIRMTQADRQYIAQKLALDISYDEILRGVREESNGILQRRHIITRKDIHNVAQALNLNGPNGYRKTDGNDKVVRENFNRLTQFCKGGKLNRRKLWLLRSRHSKALSLDVTIWEAVSDQEWVLSSEENEKEEYTVTRSNDKCLAVDCDMHCFECEACVHSYVCTCPDNVRSFNMCKHMHLVCQRMLAVSRLEPKVDDSSNRTLFVSVVASDDTCRVSDASEPISVQSQSSAGFDVDLQTAQELSTATTGLVKSVSDIEQILVVDSSTGVLRLKFIQRDLHDGSNLLVESLDHTFSSSDVASIRSFALTKSVSTHAYNLPITSSASLLPPRPPSSGSSAPHIVFFAPEAQPSPALVPRHEFAVEPVRRNLCNSNTSSSMSIISRQPVSELIYECQNFPAPNIPQSDINEVQNVPGVALGNVDEYDEKKPSAQLEVCILYLCVHCVVLVY